MSTNDLQELRDFVDCHDLGVILIGMPTSTGSWPLPAALRPDRLHPRVQAPSTPEHIPALRTHYWQQLGLPDVDVDGELVSTIVRITGGNFRLIDLASRARATESRGTPQGQRGHGL